MLGEAIPAWRPETSAAIDVVTAGLAIAREGQTDRTVSVKSGRDIVTTSDVAVEQHLRRELVASFPHVVIGEEEGGAAPEHGAPHWLVDPICGTRNYASGTPLWCVNLSLVEDEEVRVAVVGDGSTGEVLVAESGSGAWALPTDQAPRRLVVGEDSQTVIVEDGGASGDDRRWAGAFTSAVVTADRWDFRCLSSTLSSAWLATGRVSAYVCFYLTPLHGAAGVLLAQEAGARTEDVHGEPWTLASRTLVASASAEVHTELRRLLTRTH